MNLSGLQLLGSLGILVIMFGPIGIYQRLPNATGALRGLEHGPKWQITEYLQRQSASVQSVHNWIGRLKAANFGILAGAFVMFLGGAGFMASASTSLLAWVILVMFCFTPHILNGIDTVLLRAAVFPHGLWIGKRQFVTGPKARFGGYYRIAIGIFGLAFAVYMVCSLFYVVFLLLGNHQSLSH
jgi:hypothetical protein